MGPRPVRPVGQQTPQPPTERCHGGPHHWGRSPASTHVRLDSDARLTRYGISFVNATDLHTIDKPRLNRRRGLLNPHELTRLEHAIRLYLGL
jgi:mRNA-degrading endonuclease toxin of MazEF toxin-antitoxin module